MKHPKAALIVLDGWGFGKKDPSVNAIEKARTPFFDKLLNDQPYSSLLTSGTNVGLPEGQMGNSEVGHLNIGAGRVVYQPLVLIDHAFKDGSVLNNKKLQESFQYAKDHNKNVHLMGLVSDGGIHSHINHLFGLCDAAHQFGLDNVFIHAFTDGRDTNTTEGVKHIRNLREHLNKTTGEIASIIGRYYAMDRDKRWERIKKAYDLLTEGEGQPFNDPAEAIQEAYNENITDEFITPRIITGQDGKPKATINENDVVICFNYRTDRARQITEALTQRDMEEHGMKTMPLHYMTMTEYDKTYEGVDTLFEFPPEKMTLGETLSKNGKTQLRIAETEKYPHVTYFFNGQREESFENEERIMAASPKVATYDLQPEMSAPELNKKVSEKLQSDQPDLIVLNYANPDMVGHTGVFEAVVKAVETVDSLCEELVNNLNKEGYYCIVTSDHGNADFIVNDDGTPNTAHTTNLVPFFVLSPDGEKVGLNEKGRLADIAPTILDLMNIEQPEEMTGKSLLRK